VIAELFQDQDPEDPCYIIIAIMSGNLEIIKRVAGNNWKQYMLLYLVYYDPFLDFEKCWEVLDHYLAEIGHRSEEAEMSVKLFKPSLHSIIQYLLAKAPLMIAVTVGLICYVMGLLETCFEKEILGMGYRQHLLGLLQNWMSETELSVGLIYARQYGDYLTSNQYKDFFTNLISRKIEIRTVTTEKEYLQITH
jgi:hypothetical protein